MLRHFEVFLAFRYLRKKRLAFFCVAAVALSVAMLIVVSSVMGGFVEQFREACHGFYGDIVVRADSLMGFPHYEEFIVRAKKVEGVQEATPLIKQYGLLRIDQDSFKLFIKAVEILGIQPEGYSKITKFKESLWRQSEREGPVSLAIPQSYSWEIEPAGACIVGVQVVYNRKADGEFKRQIELYNSQVVLVMLPLNRRTGMPETDFPKRAFVLIDDSETAVPLVDDHTVYIDFDVAQKWSLMSEYKHSKTGKISPARASEVRVKTAAGADLGRIQKELKEVWSDIVEEKGYVGQDVVIETLEEQSGLAGLIRQLERDRFLMVVLFSIMGMVSVFLVFSIFFVIVTEKIHDIGILKSVGSSSAEKVRVAWAFAVLAPVLAVLVTGSALGWPLVKDALDAISWIGVLIACLYLVVVSLAVSGGSVGRIFLGYAAVVGLVGSLLGLAIGWPFVARINLIHEWVSERFGMVYDPNVLLFPHIPDKVDWFATVLIMTGALAGCLVGSMIPAIRAALMKPIKALRYE